MKDINTDKI